MTEEKIKESIEKFKEDHVKWIEKSLLEDGTMGPLIALLALKEDTDTMGIVFAPILGDISSDTNKLIDYVLPSLFQQVKEDGMKPYCFSFACESLVKKIDKEQLKGIQNPLSKGFHEWKDIETTEALLVLFETRDSESSHVFTMETIGKAVNKNGEVIDQVKLTPMDIPKSVKSGGKFANIFKKYG